MNIDCSSQDPGTEQPLFEAEACQLRCRLAVCLEHPQKKFLHAEIAEFKTVAELQGAEQLDKYDKQVIVDGCRSGNGVHVSWTTKLKEKRNVGKVLEEIKNRGVEGNF